MVDTVKRKLDSAGDTEPEAKRVDAGPLPELQQSDATTSATLTSEDSSSEGDEGELASILATFPPVEEWSDATIESLKEAVNARDPEAEWEDEGQVQSDETVEVIDAILAPHEGWDRERLRSCSNAEYFSLPTHTIALLNALYHSNIVGGIKERREDGCFHGSTGLLPPTYRPVATGYPIFRVDYSSDERFELYKKCWEQLLDRDHYLPGYEERDEFEWTWVSDRSSLDGKGPKDVRKLYHSLIETKQLPQQYDGLWVVPMVDTEAIESMLRVYGPPAAEIFSMMGPQNPRKKDVPHLPYYTVVDTNTPEEEDDEDGEESSNEEGSIDLDEKDKESQNDAQAESKEEEPDDGEYHGQFKCAVQSVFRLLENEQTLAPGEYYPRKGQIWGDLGFLYEAPKF